MNLTDEFEVPLGVAEAWTVLTNVERIAPCLPGIWLREVAGDEYQGVVKVKAGPVTASYEGVARYLLLDADAHQAVLKAEGHEIRGQGKGTALVTATLFPSAVGTKVQVVTVLSIDGRLSRLANGALATVSRNLIAEFAENLEKTVLAAPEAFPASPADQAPSEAPPERLTEVSADADPPEVPAADTDPVQSYPSTAGPEQERGSLTRRLAPYLTVAGFLLFGRIVVCSLRRRRR
jgi:carbon monoxide dehydrogenase subunit G